MGLRPRKHAIRRGRATLNLPRTAAKTSARVPQGVRSASDECRCASHALRGYGNLTCKRGMASLSLATPSFETCVPRRSTCFNDGSFVRWSRSASTTERLQR